MQEKTAKCAICSAEMPIERLECYQTCIRCTDQSPYVGFTNVTHKTGNDTVLVRASDRETLRKADRANRRAR